MNWAKTFTDAEGDVNLAELVAAVGGTAAISTPLVAFYWHGIAFDIQSYGVGLGAIVAALGAAQRLRGDARKADER